MELEVLWLSPTNIYQISTRTSTIKFQASTSQWSLLLCGFDEIEASNDKFNQQLVEDHISHCVQTPECLFWSETETCPELPLQLVYRETKSMRCTLKTNLETVICVKVYFYCKNTAKFPLRALSWLGATKQSATSAFDAEVKFLRSANWFLQGESRIWNVDDSINYLLTIH